MILIGIPTHKRPQLLRKCLESIAGQQGLDEPVEVFVADNHPVGREGVATTEQLACTFPFPLSAEVVPRAGISAVRNAILAEGKRRGARFIAMIDDDIHARPEWLARLIEQHSATGAEVVGGPVRFEFDDNVPDTLRREFWTASDVSGPVPFISGTGAILVACSALERMGWPMFDLALGLTGGEDKDWFLRLERQGATFAWSAEAEACEWVPRDRARRAWLLKRNFRVGIDDSRNAQRYGAPWDVARLCAKAALFLALSPVFAVRLLSPRHRSSLPNRWARAAGRLAGAMRVEFREYEGRH